MARTNLDELRKKLAAAADAVTARMEQERQTDGARIKHHIESSRAQIEMLIQAENELIAYIDTFRTNVITGVQTTFAKMIQAEQQRLAELEAHADDIATEEAPETALTPPPKTKRLNGARDI